MVHQGNQQVVMGNVKPVYEDILIAKLRPGQVWLITQVNLWLVVHKSQVF